MKIYTKSGDGGETSLYGGSRVSKTHCRIIACGDIDELNCYIGYTISLSQNNQVNNQLIKIQNDLFVMGAEVSTPSERLYLKNGKSRIGEILKDADICYLEEAIDDWQKSLEPMTHFILPGGGQVASVTHIARAVCRRVERSLIQVQREQSLRGELIKYINRLSDYLFVIARVFTKENGSEEIKWNQ